MRAHSLTGSLKKGIRREIFMLNLFRVPKTGMIDITPPYYISMYMHPRKPT